MITGKEFCKAIISSAEDLKRNEKQLNELNVFPVPDGDTGTNMSLTMLRAKDAVSELDDDVFIGKAAEITANALIRGARGNSGVILSLIFKGFAESLKNKDVASAEDIIEAFRCASYTAYSAVFEPKEGTILTVMREAANKASEILHDGVTAEEIWGGAYKAAEAVLPHTKQMLPELSRAGVVDAGGQGLVFVLGSMSNVFNKSSGKILPIPIDKNIKFVKEEKNDYPYCTQVLLENREYISVEKLKSVVSFFGDSLVIAQGDNELNVHIHTDRPGKVIETLSKYGRIENVKIENMLFQQRSNEAEKEKKKVGFVVISDGKGFEDLFLQMGADEIVFGAQTMNPSVDEILEGVNKVQAENVIILPNNKNVIMSSLQATKLSDKKTFVLKTKTIPEGITALLSFDENISLERNIDEMNRQIKRVKTGLVAPAVKDSPDESEVKKGDIIAIENGRIVDVESSSVQAAYKVARRMLEGSKDSVVTVYYGKNSDRKQAEQVVSKVRNKCPSGTEVSAVMGGQEIYDFIISVE